MSEQWYYRVFGEEFGPMPLEELKQLAEFGTIAAMDKVRSTASSQWVAAASVDELGLRFNQGDTDLVTCATSGSDAELSTLKRGTDEWFCKLGGQELGPLAFEELAEYVAHEQLTAADEVKLGDQGKWRTVGSIGRLMAVIPYKAVEKTIVPTALKQEPRAIEQPLVDAREDLSELAQDSDAPAPARARTESHTATTPKKVSPAQSNPLISTVPHQGAGSLNADAAATATRARRTEPSSNPKLTQPALPESRPSPDSSSSTTEHRTSNAMTSSVAMPRPITVPKKPSPIPTRRSGPSFLTGLLGQLAEGRTLGAIGAIAVVLLIAGWTFLPESKAGDIKRYRDLKKILDEIVAMRDNPTGREALNAKAIKLGKEITEAVIKKASPQEPAKQYLLWAARDEIPRVFSATPEAQALAEKNLAARLKEAAAVLGLESPAASTAGIQGAPLPED